MDLISRQDAIDAFTGVVILEPAQSAKKYIDGVIERIQNLTSAQPEPQWIPASERLPKIGRDRILVCLAEYATHKTWFTDTGRVFEGMYSANGFVIDRRVCENGDVIAWMPLPEPYKGE